MKFAYTIKTRQGKEESATIEAASESEAARLLRARGAVVTRLERVETTRKSILSGGDIALFGVPLKERVTFAVNLSVMVSSGLSVSRALHNLTEQTKNKQVKTIINELYNDVLSGVSLSEAMAAQPRMFDKLFVNMVRVGEAGGTLGETLTIIAHQLEKEQKLRARVRGAMMYPLIVVIAMVGVGVLMLTYILPQIMGVFADMEVELPKSTKFIIALSEALRNNALTVSLAAISLLAVGTWFFRTAAGRRTAAFLALNLPVVRRITLATNCARFSRIFSSLLRSGVPVVEALGIVRDTLGNVYYKKALDEGMNALQKGVPLSQTIRKHPRIFPVLIPQMLDVGEETGKTSAMLLKVAEFYEMQVDQMTKNLSSIIEPLLMLLIGVAVGFFAIAMLKPMYSLLENIG